MPNEPVIERMASEVARAVRTVTEANGYTHTIQEVYRTFRAPGLATAVPYACVVTEGEDAETARPLRAYNCVARISVYVFTLMDIAENDLADQLTNQIVADVKRAILEFPSLQPGQTSGDTRLDWLHYLGFERTLVGDGPSWVDGAEVKFEIQFLTHHTDPRLGRGDL